MPKNIAYIALTLATLFTVGCVSIKPIRLLPGKGGIIAVNPGFKSIYDPEVRAKAMAAMEFNCGSGKVKILEEGYVKVGEETSFHRSQNSDTASHGNATAKTQKGYSFYGGDEIRSKAKAHSRSSTHEHENATTRTYDIEQWRITYQCI